LAEAPGIDERLRKALEVVKEGRVKKYIFKPSLKTYWVVVGRTRDYLVLPGRYCTCDDFFINAVARLKVKSCYHLLAQEIAEREGAFEVYEVDDEEGEKLLNEWLEV